MNVKNGIVFGLILALVATTVVACKSVEKSETEKTAVEAQIATGQALYGAHCAKCHGASGQGTNKAPRVVGLADGALPLDPRPDAARTNRFRTAADIAQFVVAAMPPKGDKLSADEYYAILAFDLHANGYPLEKPVGPDNAASLVIPR